MDVAFQIATIILSVLISILILLQVRGDGLGALGGNFGSGLTRTRRGLERLLFQITVGISILFLVICILAVVTYQG
jgi:preprotein translocase subunit SecG